MNLHTFESMLSRLLWNLSVVEMELNTMYTRAFALS